MKNKAFFLLLITTGVVLSENLINVDQLWSSSSVFETNKDYALFGHVIKTLHVQFVAECIQECQNTLECFSYNYVYFQNGTSDHLCELNLSNKNQSKSSYIPLQGYQYGEPQDFQYCVGDVCVMKNALPDKWYKINESLLKTIYSLKNWGDAQSYCRSLGGDLMTVHSEIENKFVKRVLMYLTLLTHYSLDGTDDASEVTLYNGAKYMNKDGQRGIYFDGSNGYAKIKSFDARNVDLTIAFWFRVKSLPTAINIFNDIKESKRQFSIQSTNDRALAVQFKTEQGKSISASTAKSSFPIDKWTHFAVTWNRTSKEMIVYINLKMKASKISTLDNVDLLNTGNTKYILAKNGNFHLMGWMSDFYVFQNALTKTQLQHLADGLMKGAWLGLNDIDVEGSFKWSNNHAINYLPKIGNEESRDCLVMRRMNNNMEWKLQDCKSMHAFICEKPAV